MEPEATNNLTNEWIARMLGWKDYQTDAGYTVWLSRDGVKWYWPPDYLKRLDLCLRDILPEIVRRGYWLEICFGPGNTCVRLGQVGNGNALKTYVVLGDPPPIANAICEAYRVVMEEKS